VKAALQRFKTLFRWKWKASFNPCFSGSCFDTWLQKVQLCFCFQK